jgi:hypothetical protein
MRRGKTLPNFSTMRNLFFETTGTDAFQSIQIAFLSGQDKFTSDIDNIAVLKWTSDIAALDWIVDTVWSLTVAQHPKFPMMMFTSSEDRYTT